MLQHLCILYRAQQQTCIGVEEEEGPSRPMSVLYVARGFGSRASLRSPRFRFSVVSTAAHSRFPESSSHSRFRNRRLTRDSRIPSPFFRKKFRKNLKNRIFGFPGQNKILKFSGFFIWPKISKKKNIIFASGVAFWLQILISDLIKVAVD